MKPIQVAADFDIQGHRGARGLLPENSMPAFQKALELGVNTLEMDVVISRDFEVVVSHDLHFSSAICLQPDGSRIAPDGEQDHALFSRSYDEIARYDCGSIGNPRFPNQEKMRVSKPLLKDVVAMAEAYVAETGRPPVRYNIETKSTPAGDGVLHPAPQKFTELLVNEIRRLGALERSTMQSFDPRTLLEARSIEPALQLSLLVGTDSAPVSDQVAWLGFQPEVLSPDYHLVDEQFVQAWTEQGFEILPWTVNDGADMIRLAGMGVAGLITDYPDVAVSLLQRDR